MWVVYVPGPLAACRSVHQQDTEPQSTSDEQVVLCHQCMNVFVKRSERSVDQKSTMEMSIRLSLGLRAWVTDVSGKILLCPDSILGLY